MNRIWDEENKVEDEEVEDDKEESHHETLDSGSRCCELEYGKVFDNVIFQFQLMIGCCKTIFTSDLTG